ncbi:MAG: PEPxxWA-CTERM sorting domain-containing protein [Pseudomonadota bacterium]
MGKAVFAGIVAALTLSGQALADGPLSVETPFSTTVVPSDPFKADLASIGVGIELASPTFVNVYAPTQLTFRLLQSIQPPTGGIYVDQLVVDGQNFDFGAQAFTSPGSLLGTLLFQGAFTDLVGFRSNDMPDDAPAIGWPEAFQVYIRSDDADELEGIGPFIGSFDTLYFSIAGQALFEVTAVSAAVPEPRTWALLIGGFALSGAALRRRRSALAA